MRGLMKTSLTGALITVAIVTSAPVRSELPEDRSERTTVARRTADPEFTEFWEAMKEIRSRYEEGDCRGAEEKERRKGPAPAAPGAERDYGPGFAVLSLPQKLNIMQESFKEEWAQKELERKKQMKAYEKELDKKADRLDKEIAAIPGVLVKAGEPPALVDRFRKGWLRPDAFITENCWLHISEASLGRTRLCSSSKMSSSPSSRKGAPRKTR